MMAGVSWRMQHEYLEKQGGVDVYFDRSPLSHLTISPNWWFVE